jgi:tRNA(His) guanylyltransferase
VQMICRLTKKKSNCLLFQVKHMSRNNSVIEKKAFEVNSSLLSDCYILIHLDGLNFRKFTDFNEFEKPIDKRNVNLMVECTRQLFNSYKHDIMCAYGFSDEFTFAIEKNSQLFLRKYKYT